MNGYLRALFSLVLVLPLVISSQTRAEDGVTLEQCLQWSRERNPSILKADLKIQLIHSTRQAAVGRFLPKLEVGYTLTHTQFSEPVYIDDEGRAALYPNIERQYSTFIDDLGYLRVDTLTIRDVVVPIPKGSRKEAEAFVRLEEVIYRGGRDRLKYRNDLLENEIRMLEIEETGIAVRTATITSYYDVSAAISRSRLADQMLDHRRMQLEFARARFRAGSVTERDVLQAEVELGRARSDSLERVTDLRRAFEELNQKTGLPLDTVYTFADLPVMFQPGWKLADLEAEALAIRLDLRILSASRTRLKNAAKIESLAYFPEITAGLEHRRFEKVPGANSYPLTPGNRNTVADISLRWLVFDGFSRQLDAELAKLEVARIDIEISNLELDIRRQVRTSLERLQTVHFQLQVANDNSRLALRSLELEQESYRLGSSSALELDAIQLSYYQAEADRIELESEFGKTLGLLEASVGKPLER
jgi:outer membrane protein TolC